MVALNITEPKLSVATLAGGCFWGVEHFLKKEFGSNLHDVRVGYIGGTLVNPSYPEVKKGSTGHAEAVQFKFDPKLINFEDILLYFWRFHDPTTLNRQEGDIGTQYRSAVFYEDQSQLDAANKIIKVVQPHFSSPIVTEFKPLAEHQFFSAEEYHQDYLTKNEGGYCAHWIRW